MQLMPICDFDLESALSGLLKEKQLDQYGIIISLYYLMIHQENIKCMCSMIYSHDTSNTISHKKK